MKAITHACHLIGNWLIWKIGKGDKVQISHNPCVESKGVHTLCFQTIHELRNKGHYEFQEVANWGKAQTWHQYLLVDILGRGRIERR